MAKYLRTVEHRFAHADGRPDDALNAAQRGSPETQHLRWMYEHHCTPLISNGVTKVNVVFTAEELNREPAEVLGIATVYERFDGPAFNSLEPKARPYYFLERLHGAMLRYARQFNWDTAALEATRSKMIAMDFHFSYYWKKAIADPKRRIKAQPLIDASSFPTHLHLVFFDLQMNELRRVLLSVGVDGPGAVKFAFGGIEWLDSNTVRVCHENGRDFWLCSTEGHLEFCYPRADSGDPHGQYELGRMYYVGQWVLPDRERGLKLIRASADQGFKHAINFIGQVAN